METVTAKQRIMYLDFLKVIAIFLMVANHCVDNVTPAERALPWYNLWGSVYNSFTRPAIPLFMMVTGILLLPTKMDMGSFYKNEYQEFSFHSLYGRCSTTCSLGLLDC